MMASGSLIIQNLLSADTVFNIEVWTRSRWFLKYRVQFSAEQFSAQAFRLKHWDPSRTEGENSRFSRRLKTVQTRVETKMLHSHDEN